MKSVFAAAAMAVLGATPALAGGDFNIVLTSKMAEGKLIAPVIVVDAVKASPVMFNKDGSLSEAFIGTILAGDPRPLNKLIGNGVAGPLLGKSGPAGVQISGGEVVETDMFVEADTIRFFAKGSYGEGEDTVITGVFDISMGGGSVTLNRYDIGHTDGSNKITMVEEGAIEIVITEN